MFTSPKANTATLALLLGLTQAAMAASWALSASPAGACAAALP